MVGFKTDNRKAKGKDMNTYYILYEAPVCRAECYFTGNSLEEAINNFREKQPTAEIVMVKLEKKGEGHE